MRVIGTAGHVDHGKSTLVQALTGINPDRLREEREREMTIVLGFAWMTLPNGEEIGIVDVPGHRDFIENMLSGIGGIDAALFVIAADEGVMPQTREHLAILDLLQIQGGVVALTKIDAVEDPEWLDLVEGDVMETLSGTVLESSPIVRVSAKTGVGIDELKDVLAEELSGKPARPDLGKPRLSVDRVFSMSGFGTVVTGTLTDGQLRIGEEVVILPDQVKGRIRGLQSHKKSEDTAEPGSRTAVNISGVDVNQIERGNVIALPGIYKPSRRMDLHFRLLEEASAPLKHNTEVKLFIGATEVLARLRLLGVEILKPGHEGWIQLEISAPIVAVRGDRYILRRPSPGETLGGGIIVDPHPKRRHKRFSSETIEKLESLLSGSPEDILYQSVNTQGLLTVGNAVDHSNLDEGVAHTALNELLKSKQIFLIKSKKEELNPNDLITTNSWWQRVKERIKSEIDSYLTNYPLRLGIPREMLKSRLNLDPKVFSVVISKLLSEEIFTETQIRKDLPASSPVPVIHLPGRSIEFTANQTSVVNALLIKFIEDPYSPPTIKACTSEVGEDIYNALIDLGRLIPVSDEVVFRIEDYNKMIGIIKEKLDQDGSFTVAQIRDLFNTSRRYVLAFLEHLDAIGLTYRDGDVRRLKS